MNNNISFPRLEIHLVNHCNLNCCACAHYSNISSPFYLELSQFKSDLAEIKQKINYDLISLLGGEPLLHPQLKLFLEAAREIYPKTDITVTTNGILIKQVNEDVWEALKQNKIAIRLSVYPPTIKKMKSIIDFVHEKDVKIWDIWDGRKFYLRKSKQYSENIDNIWQYCDAKINHQLYNGKIYPCSIDAYGKFYNEHFKKQIYFDDGLDIYKNSSEEIYSYLTHPVRNCGNCDINGQIINWKFSEFKEDEWDVQ